MKKLTETKLFCDKLKRLSGIRQLWVMETFSTTIDNINQSLSKARVYKKELDLDNNFITFNKTMSNCVVKTSSCTLKCSYRDVLFEYHWAVVPFCWVVRSFEVCLPYRRLLTGILILVVFQNLRWNSNKTSPVDLVLQRLVFILIQH